jgi:Stage II sporulation protein E (SpoIIE)
LSAGAELEGLLQFFYQCPVGLLEITDTGAIRKINPAAARMLASALAGDDLQDLFPLLHRLAPRIVVAIESDPRRLGPLGDGHRLFVPSGARGDDCLELLAVRVHYDRVMIVLIDVSAERRLAQREHEIVVELQRSMLGRVDPIPGLPVAVTYRTADLGLQVGGDWYDVVGLPDQRVVLIVGDVVGHNLEATATMGQLRSAVRAVAPTCVDPARLLEQADGFADHIEGARYATLACGVFNTRTGELVHACAGHPPPLVVRHDGEASYLCGGRGPPLTRTWTRRREYAGDRLEPGDTLVMYTDGLYERRDDPADGLKRLSDVAARLHHLPVAEMGQSLADEMLAGSPTEDDVCVLIARNPVTAARGPDGQHVQPPRNRAHAL